MVVGTSFIGTNNFAKWSNQVSNGNGLKSNGFLNLGIQGFAVRKHFVYGLSLMHESLFAAKESGMSPNRTNVAFHLGAALSNPTSNRQILTTIGFGYSGLNINLHGNPAPVPAKISSPGNSISQFAFWLTPKITIIKILKIGDARFKAGLDAGFGFYFPGNYKYGHSTGQGKGSHFVGYTISGIPNINTISFTLGGFIGI